MTVLEYDLINWLRHTQTYRHIQRDRETNLSVSQVTPSADNHQPVLPTDTVLTSITVCTSMHLAAFGIINKNDNEQ